MASPAKLSDIEMGQLSTAISTLLDQHLTTFKKELEAELISELSLQHDSKGDKSLCSADAKEQEVGESTHSTTLKNEVPSTIRSQRPLPPKSDIPTFWESPKADTAANVTSNSQNGVDMPAAPTPKAKQHEHSHPPAPRLPTSASPQRSATHPVLSQSPNVSLPSAVKIPAETHSHKQDKSQIYNEQYKDAQSVQIAGEGAQQRVPHPLPLRPPTPTNGLPPSKPKPKNNIDSLTEPLKPRVQDTTFKFEDLKVHTATAAAIAIAINGPSLSAKGETKHGEPSHDTLTALAEDRHVDGNRINAEKEKVDATPELRAKGKPTHPEADNPADGDEKDAQEKPKENGEVKTLHTANCIDEAEEETAPAEGSKKKRTRRRKKKTGKGEDTIPEERHTCGQGEDLAS